jgi:hypothetical protein
VYLAEETRRYRQSQGTPAHLHLLHVYTQKKAGRHSRRHKMVLQQGREGTASQVIRSTGGMGKEARHSK